MVIHPSTNLHRRHLNSVNEPLCWPRLSQETCWERIVKDSFSSLSSSFTEYEQRCLVQFTVFQNPLCVQFAVYRLRQEIESVFQCSVFLIPLCTWKSVEPLAFQMFVFDFRNELREKTKQRKNARSHGRSTQSFNINYSYSRYVALKRSVSQNHLIAAHR